MNKVFHIAPEIVMDDISKLDSAVLFGSRSMASRPAKENFDPAFMIGAQIDGNTDWDFSAPYSEKNQDALAAAGFTYWPPGALSYKDELTMGVYIKTYPHKFDVSNPIVPDGVPVANVVLRSEHFLFSQVWNSIDPEFYYKHLWKRSPTYDFQERGLTKETICGIMDQLFKTAKEFI